MSWDEIAEEQYWEQVPKDLHEEAVRTYLGENGDAIDERVSTLRSNAKDLLAASFPGPSIVASVTAMEVMIQYFCIRPLVQGAFLSDLIAFEVAERIIPSRGADARTLLTPLLSPWKIELKRLVLPNGEPLWGRILDPVMKVRNAYVHRGDPVQAAAAELAIECVRTFRDKVVLKIAAQLKFTIQKTDCWSKVVSERGGIEYSRTSPFS